MMRNKGMVVMSAVAMALAAAPAHALAPAETAANRVVMKNFADLFYGRRAVRQALETYLSPDHIQHSPQMADGRAAAMRALTPMSAFSRRLLGLEARALSEPIDSTGTDKKGSISKAWTIFRPQNRAHFCGKCSKPWAL